MGGQLAAEDAPRAPRPIPATRRDVDRRRQTRHLLLELHGPVDKSSTLLNPIQDSLDLHPYPSSSCPALQKNGRPELLSWMHPTATRDHTMTTSLANTLTPSSIEVGAAKILIDPFLSEYPSWDKGWIGSRAGEDSTP